AGSIDVAIRRSAATTWRPAAGSRPHRTRASATSASSTRASGSRRGERRVGRDRRLCLLRVVPVREGSALERRDLVRVRHPGLDLRDLEKIDLVAVGHLVADLADRKLVDRVLERGAELIRRDPAHRTTLGGVFAVGLLL